MKMQYIYFYFPRKKRKIKKYKSFCGNRSRVVILHRRSMKWYDNAFALTLGTRRAIDAG